MKRDIGGQLQSLRMKLQAQLSGPVVVVVTSATLADGAAEIAFGLGRSFAASGRSTAVLDLWSHAADARLRQDNGRTLRLRSLPLELASVDVTRHLQLLQVIRGGASSDAYPATAWGETLEELRRCFDVTIIDVGAPTERGTGGQLLGCADAVLIAVGLGRTLVTADRDLVELLGAASARVAGTVASEIGKLDEVRRAMRAAWQGADEAIPVISVDVAPRAAV